jgi:hypothetical protein
MIFMVDLAKVGDSFFISIIGLVPNWFARRYLGYSWFLLSCRSLVPHGSKCSLLGS